MADTKEQASLLSLLAPRSVAVLGASDNSDQAAGGRPIDYMRRHGYAGRIYLVNPASGPRSRAWAAYPDLAALPDSPDVVVISVAGTEAEQAIEQCIAVGPRAR